MRNSFGIIIIVFLLNQTGCVGSAKLNQLPPVMADSTHLVWIITTKGSIVSDPSISINSLIFSALDHRAFVVDLPAAKISWGKKFKTPPATVQAANDTLFFLTTHMPDECLFALNGKQRKVIWERRIGVSESGMAVSDSLLFLGSNRNKFFAFKIASGNIQWDDTLTSFLQTRPVLYDSLVIFAESSGKVHGRAQNSGEEKWLLDLQSPVIVDPLRMNDYGYFITDNDSLFSIHLPTGQVSWRTYHKGCGLNPPIWHDGYVVIHTMTGFCHGLNPASGESVWSIEAPPIMPRPVSFGNSLVMVDRENGLIRQVHIPTGETLWSYTLGEHVLADPVLWQGLILIATTKKKMYAFKLVPENPS